MFIFFEELFLVLEKTIQEGCKDFMMRIGIYCKAIVKGIASRSRNMNNEREQ